jgi:hypothetical protein
LITAPSNGARVDQQTQVEIAYRCLPLDRSLWIVLYIPSVGRFYPQEVALNTVPESMDSETLVTLVGVGTTDPSQVGQRFDIHLVLADAAASRAFADAVAACTRNGCGIPSLPAGTVDLGTVLRDSGMGRALARG